MIAAKARRNAAVAWNKAKRVQLISCVAQSGIALSTNSAVTSVAVPSRIIMAMSNGTMAANPMVADKGLENKATWSANHVSKELKTVEMSISVESAMISIGRPYMPTVSASANYRPPCDIASPSPSGDEANGLNKFVE